jgi:hypothetical protein
MPALSVTFIGDSRQLQAEFAKVEAMAAASARRQQAIGLRGAYKQKFDAVAADAALRSDSTLFNPFGKQSDAEKYADWWNETLLAADIKAASRRNQTRSILRDRDWEKSLKQKAQLEKMIFGRSRLPDGAQAYLQEAYAAAQAGFATGALAKEMKSLGTHGKSVSGIIREVTVMLREWAQGRGTGRILGSFTILEQFIATKLKMSFLSLSIWTAAAALAAFTIYERFFNLNKLLNNLSFDVSKIDIANNYIAKLQRHISDARNEQFSLNLEIQKTIDNYNSASEAGKRLADSTKEHFNHLREMNRLSNLPENIKGDREVAIDAAEREAEIQNKIAEQKALQDESDAKKAQANSGSLGQVKTKEEDAAIQEGLNSEKEAAEGFLKGGGLWDEILARAASLAGLDSGTAKKLRDAGDGGTDLANTLIKKANDYQETVAVNDQLREQKRALLEASNKSAGDAAAIGLDLPNLEEIAAKKNADERAELRLRQINQKAPPTELSANQRIGAFAMAGNTTLIDLGRQQLAAQNKIASGIDMLVKRPNQDINAPFQ